MTVHHLSGPAHRHTLVAEIGAARAEIAALTAKRDAAEARMHRSIVRLARLPGDEPEPPTPAPARAVPLKTAAGIAGKSPDTLRRCGAPLGWAFKVGGRWMVDLEGLVEWMAGRRQQAG